MVSSVDAIARKAVNLLQPTQERDIICPVLERTVEK